MKKKSLRDEMPKTAEFIDLLREAFGKDVIDGQIRKGMRGEPVFFAWENGQTVGTPLTTDTTYRIGVDAAGNPVTVEIKRGEDGRII